MADVAPDTREQRPLEGRVIGITADRRWEEQAALFEKRGARVIHGPTMVTVDLTDDPQLRAVTDRLIAAPPRWFVVTTGAGFRSWLETVESWGLRDALVEAFREGATRMVCRGAKGVSAVRSAGLDVEWRAEHESMEEVVSYIEETVPRDAPMGLQLFDPDHHWATSMLEARYPHLVEVPVYRWRMPDDLGAAQGLVWAVVGRTVDAVTFTSQPAARFLFAIARSMGLAGEVGAAFDTDVLAVCVGPVCAEALFENGVERTVWPDPPRLVPMVKLAEQHLASRPPRPSPPTGGRA